MSHLLWGTVCIALGIAVWRLKSTNSRLRQQNQTLETQLEEAVQQLAKCEASSNSKRDGSFQKAVEGLVALGVPGLVLLVAVSTSGFAGAAAITAALAALGGPFGMLGGVGVLLLLVLVSKALTQYGLAKLAPAVIQGLISKGESPQSIRERMGKIPRWVISANIRTAVEEVLKENLPVARAE